MNTRTPTFPRLPATRLMLCLVIFLGLGPAWPAIAQTSTPTATTSPSVNPLLKSWLTTGPGGLKEKMSNIAEPPEAPSRSPNLAALLQEENRRLKQRVETLEKENTDLKAKLAGK